MPDSADRPTGATLRDRQSPPRAAPGTVHEDNDVHVVDPARIGAITTPSRPQPDCRLLGWLNTERKAIPAAPATAF